MEDKKTIAMKMIVIALKCIQMKLDDRPLIEKNKFTHITLIEAVEF